MRNLRIAVFIIVFFAVWSAFFVSVASAGEREDSVKNYIAVYTELVTSAHSCHVEIIVNKEHGIACDSYEEVNKKYHDAEDDLYQNGVLKDKLNHNLIVNNEDYYRFFERLEVSKIKLDKCVKYIDEN